MLEGLFKTYPWSEGRALFKGEVMFKVGEGFMVFWGIPFNFVVAKDA